eukprot:14279867-Ditylum_brightwellii.AAC.1
MTPNEKQVMMLSATLSKDICLVCRKFCQYLIEIFFYDNAKLTLLDLQLYYIKVAEAKKNCKLNYLFDSLKLDQVVIFVAK